MCVPRFHIGKWGGEEVRSATEASDTKIKRSSIEQRRVNEVGARDVLVRRVNIFMPFHFITLQILKWGGEEHGVGGRVSIQTSQPT